MSERASILIDRSKPWRPDVPWQVALIESLLLLIMGAFVLISPERAGDVILQSIGIALGLVSLQLAGYAVRRSEPFDAFRAGIGVTVGAIATVGWWSRYIANMAVRQILGWGLITFALLHVVTLLRRDSQVGFRWSSAAISLLTLILGITLVSTRGATVDGRLMILGITFLVFGMLLGSLAYVLHAREVGSESADPSRRSRQTGAT